jgi:multisubunit Na+/H+ antiporter MnhB subunit
MEISKLAGLGGLILVTGLLVLAVTDLPDFGSFERKHVATFFLEQGLLKTGSANIVNSIVWDFRGYDTLAEETVLFCAALGVFMIIRRKDHGRTY